MSFVQAIRSNLQMYKIRFIVRNHGMCSAAPTVAVCMHVGCEFRHLGGAEHVLYANSAPVRVVNTTFVDNTLASDSVAVIYTYYRDAAAWLQGSALLNNSAPLPLLAAFSSDGFASDVPREFYDSTDKTFITAPARPADANAFLTGDEAWLKDVRAVRPPPLPPACCECRPPRAVSPGAAAT